MHRSPSSAAIGTATSIRGTGTPASLHLRALVGRAKWRNWLLGPEFKRVRDADLVVDLSGDMPTEDDGVHVRIRHYISFAEGASPGAPYAVAPSRSGPSATRAGGPVPAQWRCDVTTRTRISRDYLQRIGVSSRRVEWTADLAF